MLYKNHRFFFFYLEGTLKGHLGGEHKEKCHINSSLCLYFCNLLCLIFWFIFMTLFYLFLC